MPLRLYTYDCFKSPPPSMQSFLFRMISHLISSSFKMNASTYPRKRFDILYSHSDAPHFSYFKNSIWLITDISYLADTYKCAPWIFFSVEAGHSISMKSCFQSKKYFYIWKSFDIILHYSFLQRFFGSFSGVRWVSAFTPHFKCMLDNYFSTFLVANNVNYNIWLNNTCDMSAFMQKQLLISIIFDFISSQWIWLITS